MDSAVHNEYGSLIQLGQSIPEFWRVKEVSLSLRSARTVVRNISECPTVQGFPPLLVSDHRSRLTGDTKPLTELHSNGAYMKKSENHRHNGKYSLHSTRKVFFLDEISRREKTFFENG